MRQAGIGIAMGPHVLRPGILMLQYVTWPASGVCSLEGV